jgi:hypothetical protein
VIVATLTTRSSIFSEATEGINCASMLGFFIEGFLLSRQFADLDLKHHFLALAKTVTGTVLSTSASATRRGSRCMSGTSLPSKVMMTSPGSNLPFAAGPSGVMLETSAPRGLPSSKLSAMSGVTA